MGLILDSSVVIDAHRRVAIVFPGDGVVGLGIEGDDEIMAS
jgi:hypothetical protein